MNKKALQFHKVRVVGRNLEELLPLLSEFGVELLPDDDCETPADLVISHGGDGSLLGAERRFPGVPKFALRDRRNNPKCQLHDERRQLQELFAGKLVPCELAKLQALRQKTGEVFFSVNDVVVSRQIPSSAIRCRLYRNGAVFCPQVISDGIVFCTPFGSTGYFQSITRGNFQQGMGVAYNNPLSGNAFSILPEDGVVEVEILRGPAVVVSDNNPSVMTLEDGEKLNVCFSKQRTLIFGLEAFRCAECFHLRSNGVDKK